MPEEVLFKSESSRSRSEIAEYLRTVADSLEGGGDVTFRDGGETVAVAPPDRPEFEVKVEREGPVDGNGELSIELEIEWPEDAESGGGSGLEIE